jgi:hypothetical protein
MALSGRPRHGGAHRPRLSLKRPDATSSICFKNGEPPGLASSCREAPRSLSRKTAALGVKESRCVLELILDVKRRGLPIVLISHNMPHVFELADRIGIHRLGRRLTVIDPKAYSMADAVAMTTGAMTPSDPRS